MAQSMTGFALVEHRSGPHRIVWRLRSVNQRYLDLSLRLPEAAAELEMAVRKRLQERFSRGRIECVLSVESDQDGKAGLELDETLLESLLALEGRLQAALSREGGERAGLSLDRLLLWPGLIQDRGRDQQSALWRDKGFCKEVMTTLDRAADELADSRRREGQALLQVMLALLDELQGCLDELRTQLPAIREELEARLKKRVLELTEMAPDATRLSQELAFFLNRIDLSEEMDRLHAHMAEMRLQLDSKKPIGRRLDFLCQELNREGNTICSKSQDATVSRLGVDIKVLVEKMREQVQNIE